MSVDLGGLELDSYQRRRGVDGADPWPMAEAEAGAPCPGALQELRIDYSFFCVVYRSQKHSLEGKYI